MPSDPERRQRIKRGQRFADEGDEAADAVTHEAKAYTPKQGQYLAFIYYYTTIYGRARRRKRIFSGISASRHLSCTR